MGLIQSLICSIMFCLERVLTWMCFAFVLIFLMGMMLVLMVYGISVGYHYAQKELAAFAMTSRTTTPDPMRMGRSGDESRPVVRLVAVNRSSIDNAPRPMLEVYQNRPPPEKIVLEKPATPIVLLETESPPPEPELLPHERDIAKRLIGRFRRSKNNTMTTTDIPFLRPFKATIHSDQSIKTDDAATDQKNVSPSSYLTKTLAGL
ncbi:uncharacterized protein LOC133524354 [Cydia pomonella]|uniref:uncharacterized protein LOC133524354 n=1 Tax=Cydia pomonella TaxID=82600 RepID=UPI002ADDA400|nr:uncharacterized protein LOC133524354 [Cydia pomonella]XP_061716310.1 uncharacterized protein LOC133524354 [Cydia pomonella]